MYPPGARLVWIRWNPCGTSNELDLAFEGENCGAANAGVAANASDPRLCEFEGALRGAAGHARRAVEGGRGDPRGGLTDVRSSVVPSSRNTNTSRYVAPAGVASTFQRAHGRDSSRARCAARLV